ncbi:hypothetical protein LSH36_196g01022 [Paralvinella palmiformis]|uniref:G-protein coupled receptors family 1 profile domain-containing protein n=1 Tax=Paralvinella palmiformis TaxID=53620 RepID=A0AAD9N4V3_9ANNE|nr:hypothetical protein LSH36_196g01022 [Paralvinella palmiformis]
MSLPSRDVLTSIGNDSHFEFLFNLSDDLGEASMFFGLNETIDVLDFNSPDDHPGIDYGDDDPAASSNYLDQQQLNGILREFRNNLFSYADTKTIVLICLYVPIFGTALVGNILVLMVVLPNRHMRNVTNCFIVNLAVADLLGKFTLVMLVVIDQSSTMSKCG